MKDICKWQIQAIYAAGGKMGIVGRGGDKNDELHALVSAVTGKDSVKSLTFSEAEAVIAELRRRSDRPLCKPSREEPPESVAPGGMTPGQKKKVWRLMYELEARDAQPGAPIGKRLCAIIQKELHQDTTPADPFKWLDYQTGGRLIESLKGYIISAQRKK